MKNDFDVFAIVTFLDFLAFQGQKCNAAIKEPPWNVLVFDTIRYWCI